MRTKNKSIEYKGVKPFSAINKNEKEKSINIQTAAF